MPGKNISTIGSEQLQEKLPLPHKNYRWLDRLRPLATCKLNLQLELWSVARSKGRSRFQRHRKSDCHRCGHPPRFSQLSMALARFCGAALGSDAGQAWANDHLPVPLSAFSW